MQTIHIKAEPLTSEAFRPFGQVIGQDDISMALCNGEQFRMGIIHQPNMGYQIRGLNYHRNSTQALVPLEGKACLAIVAPPGLTFQDASDLKHIKAFISDGSAGINIGLCTWHQALLPMGASMKMVNVQGVNSEDDTHRCDFARALDAIVEISL